METLNLIHGDCLEKMRDIPSGSVDMILTDPPYGTTACAFDTVIPFEPLWDAYKRIVKPNGTIVLFASQPFTTNLIASNLKMFKYCWTWRKSRAANFAQSPYMPLLVTEDVAVFSFANIAQNSKNRMCYYPQGVQQSFKICKGKLANAHRPNRTPQVDYLQRGTNYPNSILEFAQDMPTIHPTQKPIALLEYLIRTYTNAGETVLDSCMGSGTTGVACINTSRNFIGIERDEHYFNLSSERIRQTSTGLFALPIETLI